MTPDMAKLSLNNTATATTTATTPATTHATDDDDDGDTGEIPDMDSFGDDNLVDDDSVNLSMHYIHCKVDVNDILGHIASSSCGGR
jgi:hypothetical protein